MYLTHFLKSLVFIQKWHDWKSINKYIRKFNKCNDFTKQYYICGTVLVKYYTLNNLSYVK